MRRVPSDPSALFASLFIGTVGFALFMYGKKQQRVPQLAGGIALMGFPYFIDSTAWMLGIAVALLAAVWAAVKLGW